MERNTCQYENCQNDPEFMCKCAEQASYFCEKHIFNHEFESKSLNHDKLKNYIGIIPSDKLPFPIQ